MPDVLNAEQLDGVIECYADGYSNESILSWKITHSE